MPSNSKEYQNARRAAEHLSSIARTPEEHHTAKMAHIKAMSLIDDDDEEGVREHKKSINSHDPEDEGEGYQEGVGDFACDPELLKLWGLCK